MWPCPETEDILQGNGDEVSIFDAEDPTKRKLEYALFLDSSYRLGVVTDLYMHVFTTLFDLDPERFFATDLARKVEVTKQSESLRNPKPISDTYYIENNLDSKDKFERLKYALSINNT